MNIDTINEQFVTINILSIDVSDHKISESDAFKNIYDHTYKMADQKNIILIESLFLYLWWKSLVIQ